MKISVSAIFIVFFSVIGMTDATAQDFCHGTFTNLHFNAESGDLSGVEIRIVGTRSGKQAAIQFAEGEPGALVVTPVDCDGAHLSFRLPGGEGRVAATFDGIASSRKLAGEFIFETGARDKVVLVRRMSYWDKTQ